MSDTRHELKPEAAHWADRATPEDTSVALSVHHPYIVGQGLREMARTCRADARGQEDAASASAGRAPGAPSADLGSSRGPGRPA